jgi:hypothetical protein
MVDQHEALAVTTDLLTRFIWFALPGFCAECEHQACPNCDFSQLIKEIRNRFIWDKKFSLHAVNLRQLIKVNSDFQTVNFRQLENSD